MTFISGEMSRDIMYVIVSKMKWNLTDLIAQNSG